MDREFAPGDLVEWQWEPVINPPILITARGRIEEVLSTQYLVFCNDNTYKFVKKNERSLKEAK
jgi:hypothetical protein